MNHLVAHIKSSELLQPFLEAPLAPVHPIRDLLAHLTSTPVHAVYFPFLRFGTLHAARTAIAWAAMTKARPPTSTLQDLLGYLTIAWGGGTLVSLLLSTPPVWLLSPLPWGIYIPSYLVFVYSGLADLIPTNLPLGLALSLIDGLVRGVAITAIPSLVTTNLPQASWLTPVILGAIATCGGGWIAQLLGMHKTQWAVGVPSVLDGGLLGTLDVWGAMAAGLLYVALTQQQLYPSLAPVRAALSLSEEYTDAGVARALVVLFLAGLFAARVVTSAAVARRAKKQAIDLEEEDASNSKSAVEAVSHDIQSERESTPHRAKTSTPAPATAATLVKSSVSPDAGGAVSSPKRRRRAKKSKSPGV